MNTRSIAAHAATAVAGALLALALLWGYTRWKGPSEEHLVNPYDSPRPFYLVDVMHLLQRYSDKIWFAGQARNQRLAEWYVWRLESAADHITDGVTEHYAGDNYDTRVLTEAMLMPALPPLYAAIERKDWAAFDTTYAALVDACNGCHLAANHGYVRIKVPDGEPIYGNQDYAPRSMACSRACTSSPTARPP
jgi:hypothetical protein